MICGIRVSGKKGQGFKRDPLENRHVELLFINQIIGEVPENIIFKKTMQDRDVLIIAHRGESFDAPENTLSAINLAWRRNVDAVEIDIRLSKDDKIVVIHDEDTMRYGGTSQKVSRQTLEELKKIDVGAYRGEAWRHETIPTLDEVLDTIPKGKHLFVEIKCGTEVISPLKQLFSNRSSLYKSVIFIGLDLETMRAVKKGCPRHDAYWVCELEEFTNPGNWSPALEALIAKTKKAGLDGVDVFACDAVNPWFIQKVHSAEMRLYVWTVNEAEEAKRLRDAGVDGITTDRAMWLKGILTSL
ncbi:MAG: glycerophosphodiester phosphodiesterase [Deltaproteobacteria bacterium]|nr:glycerophosphodiester phosphodiesterase [Deltaproteobacteria bacterium]